MQTIENNLVKKSTRGFASHPEYINKQGRPSNPQARQLQTALKNASRKHNNVEFLHHVADEAYKDKSIMLAVLDKLVPNAQLPKEKDESAGLKQVIIIRADSQEAEAVSRQVHLQPEALPSDVELLGNGQDDVPHPTGQHFLRSTD